MNPPPQTAPTCRPCPAATRRLALGSAFVLALGAPAAVLLQTDGPIIQLPPMIVEAREAPLRWRYLGLPGLEILATCSDATIRRFVESYHRQEQLVRLLVPERFQAQPVVPTMNLLADRIATRRVSEDVIREIFAARGQSLPREDASSRAPPPGGFRNPVVRRRAEFLPNLRLDDRDASAVFAMIGDDGTAGQIFFTTIRMAIELERRVPALPAWFKAGILRIHEASRFTPDRVEVGPAVWVSASETAAVAADPDRPRTILPAADLFERPAPAERDSDAARAWTAQAELFVRWVMFSAGGVRRERLWRLLELATEKPLSEEVFRGCFDLSYADLRDRLSDYLDTAVGDRQRLKPARFERTPRLRIRAASEDEIGRIRGDWERMEVHYLRERQPELAGKYLEQARRTLQRAYDRGTRDARFFAVWGLCEFDAGDFESAREKLERAVAGGVIRPRAYHALARLGYDDGLRHARDGKLDATTVRRLLALLETGRRQAPLPEIFALLGDVWMHSEILPAETDLATLEEGARLFPLFTGLVGRVAMIHLQQGHSDRAEAVLTQALHRAQDLDVRSHYERLRARLAEGVPSR